MNAAIQSWRQELAAQAGLTMEIRRELEAHLYDCMSAFEQQGLSEGESFRLARQRVGQPKLINAEFKKAMNTPVHHSHWNLPLTFAAWATYVISFFLPAFGGVDSWHPQGWYLHGWQCAILQQGFWQLNPAAINYQLLLLANLWMLASPILFTWLSKNIRQVRWLHHSTLAAVILVWAFIIQLFIEHSGGELRLGCWLWAVSFVLLYFSVVFERLAMRREMTRAVA